MLSKHFQNATLTIIFKTKISLSTCILQPTGVNHSFSKIFGQLVLSDLTTSHYLQLRLLSSGPDGDLNSQRRVTQRKLWAALSIKISSASNHLFILDGSGKMICNSLYSVLVLLYIQHRKMILISKLATELQTAEHIAAERFFSLSFIFLFPLQ